MKNLRKTRPERQSVYCSYAFDSCNGDGENSIKNAFNKNPALLRNSREIIASRLIISLAPTEIIDYK